MKSYPTEVGVLDGLGDKVVLSLAEAVTRTASDLVEYRGRFPRWVADSSERGLANWIHDRMWAHLSELLDGIEGVVFADREPTREIFVGTTFRLRVKRHRMLGEVASYPTAGALAFFAQPAVQLELEGLEAVHLTAGYLWDEEARAIGRAVICLRDGLDNVVWLRELDTPSAAGGVTALPPVDGPNLPSVEIMSADEGEGTSGR